MTFYFEVLGHFFIIYFFSSTYKLPTLFQLSIQWTKNKQYFTLSIQIIFVAVLLPINYFHEATQNEEHRLTDTVMDKLQLTGQNLGRVCNFRSGRVHAMHLHCYGVKLPNLKLKTRPKQLLGYLPLDIALPDSVYSLIK
jgi:hypothetical protein